jgi:phosphopantothenoylcysteine decarboxylase/phosphopantothenate--cysteine ligase
MNQQMWHAVATQHNLSILQKRNIKLLGPAAGEQACGDVGLGRMLEPLDIIALLNQTLAKPLLASKTVLITAGPTREEIDPVRFISNHSSGKMGYAIAQAAQSMGAKVVLVSGPTNLVAPVNVTTIQVTSAAQMHQQVMGQVQDCDIFIACAAVADYRPSHSNPQKIKKNEQELTLTFIKNPDILSDVAHLPQPPFTLGFAAETQNVREYALSKLRAKKLNMIAANDVSDSSIGFNSENNALSVFWPQGEKILAMADKHQLAMQLMQLVAEQLKS